MVYSGRWIAWIALAALGIGACAGPGAGGPAPGDRAVSQIEESGSTAVRELEDLSIFTTVTPVVGFGSWAQECEPSDDPFSSCV